MASQYIPNMMNPNMNPNVNTPGSNNDYPTTDYRYPLLNRSNCKIHRNAQDCQLNDCTWKVRKSTGTATCSGKGGDVNKRIGYEQAAILAAMGLKNATNAAEQKKVFNLFERAERGQTITKGRQTAPIVYRPSSPRFQKKVLNLANNPDIYESEVQRYYPQGFDTRSLPQFSVSSSSRSNSPSGSAVSAPLLPLSSPTIPSPRMISLATQRQSSLPQPQSQIQVSSQRQSSIPQFQSQMQSTPPVQRPRYQPPPKYYSSFIPTLDGPFEREQKTQEVETIRRNLDRLNIGQAQPQVQQAQPSVRFSPEVMNTTQTQLRGRRTPQQIEFENKFQQPQSIPSLSSLSSQSQSQSQSMLRPTISTRTPGPTSPPFVLASSLYPNLNPTSKFNNQQLVYGSQSSFLPPSQPISQTPLSQYQSSLQQQQSDSGDSNNDDGEFEDVDEDYEQVPPLVPANTRFQSSGYDDQFSSGFDIYADDNGYDNQSDNYPNQDQEEYEDEDEDNTPYNPYLRFDV